MLSAESMSTAVAVQVIFMAIDTPRRGIQYRVVTVPNTLKGPPGLIPASGSAKVEVSK